MILTGASDVVPVCLPTKVLQVPLNPLVQHHVPHFPLCKMAIWHHQATSPPRARLAAHVVAPIIPGLAVCGEVGGVLRGDRGIQLDGGAALQAGETHLPMGCPWEHGGIKRDLGDVKDCQSVFFNCLDMLHFFHH